MGSHADPSPNSDITIWILSKIPSLGAATSTTNGSHGSDSPFGFGRGDYGEAVTSWGDIIPLLSEICTKELEAPWNITK